jgi:Trk K+ transport system NAD-binding subunit
VLDYGDEANATIALSVREVAAEVRTVAFVEDTEVVPYLDLAGVDEILMPRDLLGRGLADKVTSVITTQLGETIDIGAGVEIIELPLQVGCQLEGVTLGESGVREQTGANVIGAWIDGSFVATPHPDAELDRNTVLLVSGTEAELEAVMDMTMAPGRSMTREVVIAGYGQVGKAVQESLQASHISCTVIDREDRANVDVVGDAADGSVLETAGIEDAGAFIISISDDNHAVFATLVAREANPEIEIIARANETESVSKLYAAGADYVLALSRVSGRMLAESILDEDVISYDTQIDIVRTEAPAFAGQTLKEADIRARTGCTVIAVERDGEVHTGLGPEFTLEPADSLVVAGADENIARFHDLAGVRATGD